MTNIKIYSLPCIRYRKILNCNGSRSSLQAFHMEDTIPHYNDEEEQASCNSNAASRLATISFIDGLSVPLSSRHLLAVSINVPKHSGDKSCIMFGSMRPARLLLRPDLIHCTRLTWSSSNHRVDSLVAHNTSNNTKPNEKT